MGKVKNIVAVVFFGCGILFAFTSLLSSGALSDVNLKRDLKVNIVNDSYGLLKLEGFYSDYIYDLKKEYSVVGTIANNSPTAIDLLLTIHPDFSLVTNKNLWNGIKIGDQVREFTFEEQSPQQIQVSLDQGATVNIEIAVSQNHSREIITSFEFIGISTEEEFKIELGNEGTRQIIYK